MQKIKQEDYIRSFFKRWPKLYYILVYVFGPAYLGGLNSIGFVEKYNQDKSNNTKIINLGSGPRRISKDILNVDFEKFEGVDIVADVTNLPFENESIDSIISDNVLEHVADAKSAVDEMYRVLKPGGLIYVSTPFLYPYHSSPSDYNRWTDQGLKHLFNDFNVLELGTRSGIFSTISVVGSYFLAAIFSLGSNKLYWLIVNLSLIIFFPIKFLDFFANKLPLSTRTASVLYIVLKK